MATCDPGMLLHFANFHSLRLILDKDIADEILGHHRKILWKDELAILLRYLKIIEKEKI